MNIIYFKGFKVDKVGNSTTYDALLAAGLLQEGILSRNVAIEWQCEGHGKAIVCDEIPSDTLPDDWRQIGQSAWKALPHQLEAEKRANKGALRTDDSSPVQVVTAPGWTDWAIPHSWVYRLDKGWYDPNKIEIQGNKEAVLKTQPSKKIRTYPIGEAASPLLQARLYGELNYFCNLYGTAAPWKKKFRKQVDKRLDELGLNKQQMHYYFDLINRVDAVWRERRWPIQSPELRHQERQERKAMNRFKPTSNWSNASAYELPKNKKKIGRRKKVGKRICQNGMSCQFRKKQ